MHDASCILPPSILEARTNPAEELRYLILAAQREGSRELARALRPLGLTPAQAEVLAVLDDAAPLSVRGLGERLVCESGSPSRLVASLVAAGLVQSRPSLEDGRAAELSLTATGSQAAEVVRRVEHEMYTAIAAAWTDEEIPTVLRVLRRLLADRPAGRALELRRRAETAGPKAPDPPSGLPDRANRSSRAAQDRRSKRGTG